MNAISVAIDGVLVASVAVGLPVTVRAVKDAGTRRAATLNPRTALRLPPVFWLTAVIAVVYCNQVLFTVYVMRVRGGDVSFIARYLPPGWFALADHGRPMRELAAAFPVPSLLAPSVLRVQAALELPLVILAYLTVARWWDLRLFRALTGPLPLALTCTTYTVTFGLIEWSLPNPYTKQDIVIRVLSAAVTPVLIHRLRRTDGPAGRGPAGTRTVCDLILFGVSAGALGYLILTVYDTALLYNLAHLRTHASGSLVALALLTAARLTSRARTGGIRPRLGIGFTTLTTGSGWFIALFFIPALTIRYALGFATPMLAAGAAAAVALTAALRSGEEIWRRMPRAHRRRDVLTWLAQSLAALLVGAAAGTLARLMPPGYPEAKLLLAAILFLAAAIVVYTLSDALLGGQLRGLDGTATGAPRAARRLPTPADGAGTGPG